MRGTFSGAGAAPDPGIARRVTELAPWFHNLHLPDGTQTRPESPFGDFPAVKWREIGPALPADLTGWSALDIGCNAGFHAIELARRGAAVTAVDANAHYLRQARWAADLWGASNAVSFRCMQVYDLWRLGQTFDLVLFMGVFYHLRYPLLGLDIVAETVGRLLVFQTLAIPGGPGPEPPCDLDFAERGALGEPGWPRMAFIERRLAGDPTNWWAPDVFCAEALLRSAGLAVLSRPSSGTWLCAPGAREREDAGMIRAERDAALGRSPQGGP